MTEHRLGAHPERRVLAATLGPGLTLLARPGISARAVQDQSASPRRRLTRRRPRGGGLRSCAAGVGEFPVLVEWLCARNGFVNGTLALAGVALCRNFLLSRAAALRCRSL